MCCARSPKSPLPARSTTCICSTAGTNFGFWGGRTVGSPATFMTTSYDYDAPLLEAGGRGAKYQAVKRISTFLSQFGSK
jgi:beta-galactosidase